MQDKSNKRRPGELVFCLILLVFSVTAFSQSYAISGFSGKTTAGVFPMLASATMVVTAIVIFFQTLCKTSADAPIQTNFIAQVLPLTHVILISMIAVYLMAMHYVGFILSSGLFLFTAFQYLWRKNVLVTLVLSVVTLLVIYIVFRQVFQVVLPHGVWLRGLS